MRDSLVVLQAPRPGLRLVVACVAELSRDAARRHELLPGSAAALAQALAGTLLVVAAEDDAAAQEARVDVQLECKGPLRGWLVDADGDGRVRGMVRVSNLDRAGRSPERSGAASPAAGRFDSRPLLASDGDEIGMLSILRRTPQAEGELHRTLVPFDGSDLAEGLNAFLRGDRLSAGEMALEVLFGKAEPLAAVAGVLAVPLGDEGAPAAMALSAALREGGLAQLLAQPGLAGNAHALAARIGEDHRFGPLQLASELRPRFSCRCSRERLVTALRSLGAPELRDMADKDGGAEATCDFCATSYVVSREELIVLAGSTERV